MEQCSTTEEAENDCFGGSAKLATAVQKIRQVDKNVLFLDAGDQFQGTLWYSILKYFPTVTVMNHLKYDAMAFGNHEFDDGLEGLAPFVKLLSFPLISSNMNATGSLLDGTFIDSLVLNFEQVKVGIVGYTTPETAQLSNPGDKVTFHDEVNSLRHVVSKLEANGVNIIIALGHSGISHDRMICQQVPGVDITVGGHTNTFLFAGEALSIEQPEGPYPEVHDNNNGKDKCLVITDFAFGKYLGHLQVVFSYEGAVLHWTGNPILLDNRFHEDVEMQRLLAPYAEKLKDFQKMIVGTTAVAIDGMRKSCRLTECNLGNIVLDAAVYVYVTKNVTTNGGQWANSAVAIMNGGGIRELQKDAGQNITLEELYSVLPFGNTFSTIKLRGSTVRAIFEHSVSDYSLTDTHGKFLQVSGIKIVYNLNKPNGHRVKSLSLRCSNCTIPKYQPLNDDATYNVIATAYLMGGGDGYDVIKNNILRTDNLQRPDIEVLMQYLKNHMPLTTGIEGRILFTTDSEYDRLCSYASKPMSFLTLIAIPMCMYLMNIIF